MTALALPRRTFPEWMLRASCRTQNIPADLFFPATYGVATTKTARAICAKCPVTNECLELALTNGEPHGVWGGLTPRARRTLKERKRSA